MKVMLVARIPPRERPRDVLLTIRRGDEWKVESRMPEDQALRLAAECRKRGLVAGVSHGH